jgi:hypothetical protein
MRSACREEEGARLGMKFSVTSQLMEQVAAVGGAFHPTG